MTTEPAPTTTDFIKAAKDDELPTLSQQDFERVGLMVNKLGMLERGVRDRALSIVSSQSGQGENSTQQLQDHGSLKESHDAHS